MGNKSIKYKYEKLFDPSKFDIEGCIKYYQFIETTYPLSDIDCQINNCYRYFISMNQINNLEKYMNEGSYILALIREIKKEDRIKYDNKAMKYYDKMYKEIYDTLALLG